MNKIRLQRLLPYLRHLDKHPALPVPSAIRSELKDLVVYMEGLKPDTVVSEWVSCKLAQLDG